MTICGSSEAPAPFPRPVREYSIFPETAHGARAYEPPHINGAGASELPHMFKELNVP
ncbi:hypothetical protein HDR70_05320 [bacterium]|nr:hypothetical protein [bacterium]